MKCFGLIKYCKIVCISQSTVLSMYIPGGKISSRLYIQGGRYIRINDVVYIKNIVGSTLNMEPPMY